jgi:hypothetical protein
MRWCKQSLGSYLDARQLDDLAAHRLRVIRFRLVSLVPQLPHIAMKQSQYLFNRKSTLWLQLHGQMQTVAAADEPRLSLVDSC